MPEVCTWRNPEKNLDKCLTIRQYQIMTKKIPKLDVRLGELDEPTWQLMVQLTSEDSSLAEWARSKLEDEFQKRGIPFTPYQDKRKTKGDS